MKEKKIGIIILLLTIFVFLHACQAPKEYRNIFGETQGTTYSIIYDKKEMLKPLFDSILNNFDMSLSTYIEGTIIDKVNKNEEVELDSYFKTVFDKAMEISQNTDGMFDITVAPLINAYGFGFTEKTDINDTIIDSLLQFIGFDKIKIVNNKIEKKDPRTMLDCNAIAQGYAVDVIAQYLESIDCENFMIEIGGELITKGNNESGKNWKIGIDKPIENTNEQQRELQTVLSISNKAIATSGDYRRFYLQNGVKYSHSINPKTGKSAKNNLLSATIIADDCMTADGYATACMIVGLEKAKEIVNNIDGLEAYFIYSDIDGEYKVFYTVGFNDYILEKK